LSYVPRSWKRQDEQKSLSGFKRSDLIQIFGESCHRKSE